MVRRQAFFESCLSVLEPGGFLVWLDQVRPMWRKAEIDYVIGIGIFKSSNHRVRGMWTFRKKVAA